MKIVAFAGSNSSTSINKQLVVYALTHFSEDQINVLDLRDYALPMFSIDEEKLEKPAQAFNFIQQIQEADAIICSVSEHNHNFTAVFKNLLDWCSRIDMNFLQQKPMFLMSTSPGGYGGGNAMKQAQSVFPTFKADIVDTFSLPRFYENFDQEKNVVIDSIYSKELTEKLDEFKARIHSSFNG